MRILPANWKKKANAMKIAVLMSSYNGEAYIKEQITSILAQQGDFTLELKVRDDGSTDATHQILDAYAAEGKLQWYTGENLGPAKSFLHLVQQYPGYDYYAFADQDDVWDADKVARGIQALEGQTGPAMYAANARLVNKDLQPMGKNTHSRAPHYDFYTLVCAASVLGCTCVFNGNLAKAVQEKPLPESLVMHDFYLAILCAYLGGPVIYDHTPAMEYRQHGENVVGTQWTKTAALKNRIRRITKRAKVSIAEQAQSLLERYSDQAAKEEYLRFLQQVSSYKKSLFKAVKLSCSRKPNYNSKNMAVTMRLAILLRNR